MRTRPVHDREYTGNCRICGQPFTRTCQRKPVLCFDCSQIPYYQRKDLDKKHSDTDTGTDSTTEETSLPRSKFGPKHKMQKVTTGICPVCDTEFTREHSCGKSPIYCRACSALSPFKRKKILAAKAEVSIPVTIQQPSKTRTFGNPFFEMGTKKESHYTIPKRKAPVVMESVPASTLSDATALDKNTCPICCLPYDENALTCPYCQATYEEFGKQQGLFRLLEAAEDLMRHKQNPSDKPIEHWDDSRVIAIDMQSTHSVFVYLKRQDIFVRTKGQEHIVRTTGSLKRSESGKSLTLHLVSVVSSILRRPDAAGSFRTTWLSPAGKITEARWDKHKALDGGVASVLGSQTPETDIAVDDDVADITPTAASLNTSRRYVRQHNHAAEA